VSNREELFWRIALNLVGVASLKKGAAGVGQTLDIADCQLPIADFVQRKQSLNLETEIAIVKR
jgi:hypothetical protein